MAVLAGLNIILLSDLVVQDDSPVGELLMDLVVLDGEIFEALGNPICQILFSFGIMVK